jgi:hypothetical protein
MPGAQAKLWPRLGDIPDSFVLYGGTALALRLGHRESADFDFFSPDSFVPTDLLGDLAFLGPLTVNEAAPNTLIITTESDVHLSLFGAVRLQSVAEPSIVQENGIVIASLFDLAGTKAKALLDRSEWKDYTDIATLLRAGLALAEIIGYAATVFEPVFAFPTAVFLRSLAWFGDGTARNLPDDMKHELERAVAAVAREDVPVVSRYSASILP